MNQELPDVKAGLRKDRGIHDQIANIRWVIEKTREFWKNTHFFTDYTKPLNMCITTNRKILKDNEITDLLNCP